jgi:hypothetical protein
MQSIFNLEKEVEDDRSKSIVDRIENVRWVIFYDDMSKLHFYSNLTLNKTPNNKHFMFQVEKLFTK